MNDPKRLLTSDVGERELRLLRAGVREEPPADGAARLALALGVLPQMVTRPDVHMAPQQPVAPTAGDGAGAAVKAAGSGATKWLALVGAGGFALMGTALLVQRSYVAQRPASNQTAEQTAKQTAPAPVSDQAGERASTQRSLQFAPEEIQPRRSIAPTTPAAGSIAEEIALLERVRVLLTRGDGTGALQLLSAYEREHAVGALDEEAQVMRVQALALSGRRAEARRVAARFERRYPGSVHRARARAVAESVVDDD